jgi:hypothetical protein
MRKFYREEARRILAGSKKLSTILITGQGGAHSSFREKKLTGKRMAKSQAEQRGSAPPLCGKAEDGSG